MPSPADYQNTVQSLDTLRKKQIANREAAAVREGETAGLWSHRAITGKINAGPSIPGTSEYAAQKIGGALMKGDTGVTRAEAQLANLEKAAAKAKERLIATHEQVKDALSETNRTPEQEAMLDENINHAIHLRKRLDYFQEVGKEIADAENVHVYPAWLDEEWGMTQTDPTAAKEIRNFEESTADKTK